MIIAIVGACVIVAVIPVMRTPRIQITVADPDDDRWWNVFMCRDLGVPSDNLANATAAQTFLLERLKIILKKEVDALTTIQTGSAEIGYGRDALRQAEREIRDLYELVDDQFGCVMQTESKPRNQ